MATNSLKYGHVWGWQCSIPILCGAAYGVFVYKYPRGDVLLITQQAGFFMHITDIGNILLLILNVAKKKILNLLIFFLALSG